MYTTFSNMTKHEHKKVTNPLELDDYADESVYQQDGNADALARARNKQLVTPSSKSSSNWSRFYPWVWTSHVYFKLNRDLAEFRRKVCGRVLYVNRSFTFYNILLHYKKYFESARKSLVPPIDQNMTDAMLKIYLQQFPTRTSISTRQSEPHPFSVHWEPLPLALNSLPLPHRLIPSRSKGFFKSLRLSCTALSWNS